MGVGHDAAKRRLMHSMETWAIVLGIGIAIPAILIAMAILRRRREPAESAPDGAAARSAEQQKALERRQTLGYTQNAERDL